MTLCRSAQGSELLKFSILEGFDLLNCHTTLIVLYRLTLYSILQGVGSAVEGMGFLSQS